MGVKGLREVMLREIEEGIDGTGVRPGVLKVALGGITPNEEDALRACAQLAAETGMSLTIHPGYSLLEPVRIARQEGLDPSRVVVAHVGFGFAESDLATLIRHPETWGLKLDAVLRVLDTGANVSCEFLGQNVADEFGGWVGTTDWQRMAGVYALIERGYDDQIVLGTDTCAKMLTRRFGGEGYLKLFRFVLYTMRKILGMDERVIRKIFYDNPARILAY